MPLLDSATDFAMGKALDWLFGVAKIIIYSKSASKELKEKLSPLKAVIHEIVNEISKKVSDSDSSPERVKLYKDFQAELNEGLRVVDELGKMHCFDLYRRYRYGSKVLEIHQKIKDFIDIQGSPYVVCDLQELTSGVRDLERLMFDEMEKLNAAVKDIQRCLMEDVIPRMNNNPTFNAFFLQQIETTQISQTAVKDVISRMNNNPTFSASFLQEIYKTELSQISTQLSQISIDGMDEPADVQQSISCPSQLSDMREEFVVGLDNPIDDVRKILLQNDVNVVGITGMGGSGKTTLALALSNDPSVKAYFQDRVFFFSVLHLDGNAHGSHHDGNAHGVSEILENMWDKILGGPRPNFQGKDDARYQLQKNISSKTNTPTLVILDDVWSQSNAEQLLFKAQGYKTIITTRHESVIPITSDPRTYRMRILKEDDALKLFCFWAFGSTSIPITEKEDLVKQVAAECHGLPLALKVIGSCLRGQPRPVWESAADDLHKAEYQKDYYREGLLDRLKMSINMLDDEPKQCFLDLGAFPQGGKFGVDSLLDIWVYVRGMEWPCACTILLELASRNLLNLIGYSEKGAITCNYCASELSFSQHDVMRDLALHIANQKNVIDRKRLFMPCKDGRLPTKWQTLKDQASRAQFLSIHTGAMQEQDWCQIGFPEVEALGLFFASSEYCLPTFLHTMPKLKVLIIYNYSSQRARLSGLPSFPSLDQIRSVLFNKLIVPPLYENCKSWERLEKLYVCLCEGLGSITLVDNELEALNFPNIKEINLDHCSDLRELPVKLCSLTSLQKLSITNCHLVPNLPDDLGRLSSLKVLRLSACPSLSRLPLSIYKLRELEYLDISLCSGLQNLPTGFDQLPNIETLDMRECSKLKHLPPFRLIRSLKRVIVSEENQKVMWLSTNPNLDIHVVSERFNLDWLED